MWVAEPVPAWTPGNNRLSRLKLSPKHQLADTSLAARLLNVKADTLAEAALAGQLFRVPGHARSARLRPTRRRPSVLSFSLHGSRGRADRRGVRDCCRRCRRARHDHASDERSAGDSAPPRRLLVAVPRPSERTPVRFRLAVGVRLGRPLRLPRRLRPRDSGHAPRGAWPRLGACLCPARSAAASRSGC